MSEIKLADKREESWRKRAVECEKRHGDERAAGEAGTRHRVNIFWSNTEILRPALHSNQPQPDARRRHPGRPDPGNLGRDGSTILERGVSWSIDENDYEDELDLAIDDYLITGRGTMRVNYEAETQDIAKPIPLTVGATGAWLNPEGAVVADKAVKKQDDGTAITEKMETVVLSQNAWLEHVRWDDLRLGPAQSWREMPWVGFRKFMTRDDLVDNFGAKIGKACKLSHRPTSTGFAKGTGDEDKNLPEDSFMRAEVWEIWDKSTKSRLFICEGYKEAPLKEGKAPLDLKGFFPMPPPIYSVKRPRTLEPTPEYYLYQDQAKQLDLLATRRQGLIDALKVRGAYDGSFGELETILAGEENKMQGVRNWGQLQEKGGLGKAMEFVPIEGIVGVVRELGVEMQGLIQTIFQVTGISDVMRGSTDPGETMGAQEFKVQFGSLRLKARQRKIAMFVRNGYRLVAEVVADLFTPQMLATVSGIEARPEVVAFLRKDKLRGMVMDVESDTTVLADDTAEKKNVTELIAALGGFAQALEGYVRAGIFPTEVVKVLGLWAMRRFKVSREIEDLLEQPTPPAAPDPKIIQAAAELKAETARDRAETKNEAAEIARKAQEDKIDALLRVAEQIIERERIAADERIAAADRTAQARVAAERPNPQPN